MRRLCGKWSVCGKMCMLFVCLFLRRTQLSTWSAKSPDRTLLIHTYDHRLTRHLPCHDPLGGAGSRGGQPSGGIGRLSVTICHGNHHPSPNLEDPASVRHSLSRVGIYLPRNPCGSPRSSAIPFRGDAFLNRGTCSLWLDDRTGRALAEQAPMGLSLFARDPVFHFRLRPVVLG